MLGMRPLAEITLKVPGPFAGVGDLGFSARYPEQSLLEPLRDVALWIEGPQDPMRRLEGRLRMLAALVRAAYGWSPPVMLTQEVAVMSFQDRSTAGLTLRGVPAMNYVLNLVRPVVFPFLRDCAEVAHVRLADRIDIGVSQGDQPVAALSVRWDQITASNGEDLLVA
jgi:hypothetical protein